uniref:Uncharacterized protein n=1 Tax=Pyrodinium bahamense TaxID=73915 RepID=A0A7R9ZXJ7_9DINO
MAASAAGGEDEGAGAAAWASEGTADFELLVSGIPEGLTEEDLRDLFDIHGSTASVRVASGPGGRFGLVCYEEQESMLAAIEHMDGHPLLDAKLQVRRRKAGEAPWELGKAAARGSVARVPLQAAGGGEGAAGVTGCDLVIFHLPDHYSSQDLTQLCELHGRVVSASVSKERGPLRTYGVVRFTDRVSASMAMASLQGQRVDSSRLRVEVKLNGFEQQLCRALGEVPAAAPPAAAAATRSGGGTAAAIRSAVATPDSGMAPNAAPWQQERIEVPKKMVRVLIGKDGQTIKHLCRESRAQIEVSRAAGEFEAERAVYLAGPPEAVAKAKRLIQATLRSARDVRPGDPNAEVVRVSEAVSRTLLGAGGETITGVRKESGARIETVKDESNPDFRFIIIAGPDECVEYAREQVLEIVAAAEAGGGGRVERAAGPGAFPIHTDRVEVPDECVGRVIGRGGEMINKICRDTGAKISSRKGTGARTLLLSGSEKEVEEAKRLIEETIRERQGRGRAGHRDSEQQSSSRVVRIPDNLVGAFIGKGGDHIHRLSQATGCRISVPPSGMTGSEGGERKVDLSGSPEAIEKAQEAVDEFLVRGAWDMHGEADNLGDGGLVSEKIYVDEVALPRRPDLWQDQEDGMPHDVEIFVKGLPTTCREHELWSHLCSLGARDVQEILLLKRAGKSKGAAYVLFRYHESALLARSKLHGAPAASLTPESFKDKAGQTDGTSGDGRLTAWFSESERCIKGRHGVYGSDIVGLLLGSKGSNIQQLRDETGLRKVIMTGAHMRSYGQVDEDPRLHLVVRYERGEEDRAARAYEAWAGLLERLHVELAEKRDGAFFQLLGAKPSAKEDEEAGAEGSGEGAPVDEEDLGLEGGEEESDGGPGGGEEAGAGTGKEAPGAGEGAAGAAAAAAWAGEEGRAAGAAEEEPGAMRLAAVVRARGGGEERRHEAIAGEYEEFGEHQGRPVYRKAQASGEAASEDPTTGPEVYIYYLDPDAGDEAPVASWWFGSAIGGDEVWAKCLSEASAPPEGGWELTNDSDEGLELSLVPASQVASVHSGRKRRRRVRRRSGHEEERQDRPRHHHRHERPSVPGSEQPALARPQPPSDWRAGYRYPPGSLGPPLPAPHVGPPPPWVAVPYGAAVYYVNQETGERSWHPPPAGAWPTAQPRPAPGPPPPPPPPPLAGTAQACLVGEAAGGPQDVTVVDVSQRSPGVPRQTLPGTARQL